jgi:hypothetical protein
MTAERKEIIWDGRERTGVHLAGGEGAKVSLRIGLAGGFIGASGVSVWVLGFVTGHFMPKGTVGFHWAMHVTSQSGSGLST